MERQTSHSLELLSTSLSHFVPLINGKVHLFVSIKSNSDELLETNASKPILVGFGWPWFEHSLFDGYQISSSFSLSLVSLTGAQLTHFPRLFIGHFVANSLNNGDSHGNSLWSHRDEKSFEWRNKLRVNEQIGSHFIFFNWNIFEWESVLFHAVIVATIS